MRIRTVIATVALPVLAATGMVLMPQGAAVAAGHVPTEGAAAVYGNDVAYSGARVVVMQARPATPAQAAQLDAAAKNDSHGCSGSEVSNNSYVHVCYVRDGDVLWVKDDETNGRSAVGQIEGYDSASGGYIYRVCRSPYTAASGKWKGCGFGLIDENTTVAYFGFDRKDGTYDDHATGVEYESSS